MGDNNFLLKQTYTQRELTDQLTLIGNNASCRRDSYNMPPWTDTTYTNLIDILDYLYEDYLKAGQDGYCSFCLIYNNIIIQITNDSDISQSNLSFAYVEAQIDMNDLNQLKQVFFSAF